MALDEPKKYAKGEADAASGHLGFSSTDEMWAKLKEKAERIVADINDYADAQCACPKVNTIDDILYSRAWFDHGAPLMLENAQPSFYNHLSRFIVYGLLDKSLEGETPEARSQEFADWVDAFLHVLSYAAQCKRDSLRYRFTMEFLGHQDYFVHGDHTLLNAQGIGKFNFAGLSPLEIDFAPATPKITNLPYSPFQFASAMEQGLKRFCIALRKSRHLMGSFESEYCDLEGREEDAIALIMQTHETNPQCLLTPDTLEVFDINERIVGFLCAKTSGKYYAKKEHRNVH
jgi:hypothetical protein